MRPFILFIDEEIVITTICYLRGVNCNNFVNNTAVIAFNEPYMSNRFIFYRNRPTFIGNCGEKVQNVSVRTSGLTLNYVYFLWK